MTISHDVVERAARVVLETNAAVKIVGAQRSHEADGTFSELIGTLGIRTAICAPDQQIVSKLQQIAETREARYAASRDAARQSLQ